MTKDTLDLHGYKTDDVELAIDKLLMKLNNTNLKRARILTGKGTGAVRAVAIKYLTAIL
jgi:dsDNA-specific endonuclease/ATPase MutS2